MTMLKTVDKEIAMPAYQQVKQLLLQNLQDGKIKPGEKMPSESQLCNMYSISRITVRQAVASLVNDGLLHTVPGKGTFANDLMQEAHLEYIAGFTSSARKRGLTPNINVLCERVIEADKKIAGKLNIQPGEKIIHIKRVKTINSVPLYIEERYIPHKYCPGLVEENLGDRSLTDLAKGRFKLNVKSRDIVVMPITLDGDSALLLNAEKGRESLLVFETLFLEDGSVFKWEKRIHKSGLHFTTKAIIRA